MFVCHSPNCFVQWLILLPIFLTNCKLNYFQKLSGCQFDVCTLTMPIREINILTNSIFLLLSIWVFRNGDCKSVIGCRKINFVGSNKAYIIWRKWSGRSNMVANLKWRKKCFIELDFIESLYLGFNFCWRKMLFWETLAYTTFLECPVLYRVNRVFDYKFILIKLFLN